MEAPRAQQRESLHLAATFLVLVTLGLFTFGSYVAFDNNRESETSITGAATADEEIAVDSSGAQIGIYKVTPSFSVLEDYNIVGEYDALQKDIRQFYDAIQTCVSGSDEREKLESCIQETLEDDLYSSWLLGEDCETPEETLFYDVTEVFRACGASGDTDCTCVGQLSGLYTEGEYAILVSQEDDGTHFSLDDMTVVLPSTSLAIEGTPLVADTMTLAISDTVSGSFSALEPSSTIYLYKQGTTLSVESESTFTLYEGTRDACTISEEPTYKFCKQSSTAIPVYDRDEKKTIQQPAVYLFAVDFPLE
ncbi:hypothetical protein HZC31_02170 [Candidatus Woesearchaeota archaeon]|nr:hypothetical protein [Candidatus Woesearchaeota archaeon]